MPTNMAAILPDENVAVMPTNKAAIMSTESVAIVPTNMAAIMLIQMAAIMQTALVASQNTIRVETGFLRWLSVYKVPKFFPKPRAGNLLIHSFAHFAQIKWATVSPQIAQDKWVTVSDSLRSLGNERPWANRSGCSRQMMSDHEQFAQVAQSKWANERFAQKILAKKIKNLVFSMFYKR